MLCGNNIHDILDARLQQIRAHCVSKDKSLKYFDQRCISDVSSDFLSDNSIEQTAKYMYIEDL